MKVKQNIQWPEACIWITLIVFSFAYCTRAKAAPRELPVETMCVRDGFVIYNGMTVGFKKLSPNRFSFIDLTYQRNQTRTVYGQCYRYVAGTWEQPRKGESK